MNKKMNKQMSKGMSKKWLSRMCISKDWVMNNDSHESKVKRERKVNYKVKMGDGEDEGEGEEGLEKKKRGILRKNCNIIDVWALDSFARLKLPEIDVVIKKIPI